MKTQLKEEMDNLLREHMSQTEQLQVDFNTSTQLLEEKYKQLEERYQEISELYDDRPSRTEDLEIIKALKKENRFAIEAKKKAEDDMKTFKLMLEDRENSYNKMFGTTPMVGTIDPRGK